MLSASAVLAIGGLSLTALMPAFAVTGPAEAPSAASRSAASQPAASRSAAGTPASLPGQQSYTVADTVDVEPSVARDGYTATSPQVLQARIDAALALKTSAGKKAAAIRSILKTPVTVVSVNAAALSDTTPADDVVNTATADESVTTTTVGTVADVVSESTLESASATQNRLVAAATKYVGVVPYVHGGATPEQGFDCSGLVKYVYAEFGVDLIHDVDAQAAAGTEIPASKLQPGDLVVYPHQHIGIYIGDGYMVDAPDVGRDVEVQKVWGAPTFVHIEKA